MRFVVHRVHAVTPENVNNMAPLKADSQPHEDSRTFWSVFKHCNCTEEYRRTPSIFGDLEYSDTVKAPKKVVPAPIMTWMGASAVQDWEWAAQRMHCKACDKAIWGRFTYYEEYVAWWCRELVIYERCEVDLSKLANDPIYKLDRAEAGNAAHYFTRPLTSIEMMKYLGYSDFTPKGT